MARRGQEIQIPVIALRMQDGSLIAPGGINLKDDPRAVADHELRLSKNLAPFQPGLLSKRGAAGVVQGMPGGSPVLNASRGRLGSGKLAFVWIVSDTVQLYARTDGAGFELADAQLRTLQVDEDADRTGEFRFDLADDRVRLPQSVGARMAHVDAENVGAGFEQPADHFFVVGGRTEGGDDLDSAITPH